MADKFETGFARMTQFFSWILLAPFFYIFFNIHVIGKENISRIKSPFIVAANHISFYDSFLLRLVFIFFRRHLPLRFMAVKKFEWPILNLLAKIGFIDIIYILFGVFTITEGWGAKVNLRKASSILFKGGNVVMYPEGRVTTDGHIGKFKIGVALLAQMTGALVVPIAFRLEDRTKKFRKTILINIGIPFHVAPNEQPQIVLDDLAVKIEHLHSH